MPRHVRYGDYVQAVTVDEEKISYSKLMPSVQLDSNGNEVPQKPDKLRMSGMDVYNVIKPYVSVRFMDQVNAVVPLAAYLALFQILVLGVPIPEAALLGVGLLAVMFGLMLFMEGLKLGLMPFGETIGSKLPLKLPLIGVLVIAFLLGIGVTFAEPAIGALQAVGSIVDPNDAPYLYTLLSPQRVTYTVLFVGAGVGVAAVVGTLRFLYDWSLKPLIYIHLIPVVILTGYCFFDPDLVTMIGLAWDCGAVTTGPVTVPLVLALGIGVANAGGQTGKESKLQGFGIVTLASLNPILAVLLLAIFWKFTVPVETILAEAELNMAAAAASAEAAWHTQSPYAEVVGGVRAIVPLVIFLMIVLFVVLREKLPNAGIVVWGLFLSVVGMCIFSIGLTYGLAQLGAGTGGLVPGLFVDMDDSLMPAAPLYNAGIGIAITALFCFLLGFGATLAEPALNALGLTVQDLTNGSFKKSMLMYSVSTGVAVGITLGIMKLIFGFSILYILVPGYILGIVLTYLSTEEFVNVGWDSAGVTTGPITVPLVLAMGLGFGKAVGAVEGFGILAAASISPIVAVLALGVYVQWRVKKDNERAALEAADDTAKA